MRIPWKPIKIRRSVSVCQFHKVNPGRSYPACTCSGSISTREKPPEDWTKEEAQRYHDQCLEYHGIA